MMDRSDFMSLLYKEVQFFETRWNRGQRSDTPEHWPNEMEEGDWWGQFMAHLEMQGRLK